MSIWVSLVFSRIFTFSFHLPPQRQSLCYTFVEPGDNDRPPSTNLPYSYGTQSLKPVGVLRLSRSLSSETMLEVFLPYVRNVVQMNSGHSW